MSFKALVLIIFIALCGTFIYLKIQINGNENSKFNQTTRFSLGKYAWVRKILGLHNDGDARGWYLSPQSKLIVEVARAENVELNKKVLGEFVRLVEIYTGKKVVLFNKETFKSGKLTEADLKEIVLAHRRYEVSSGPNLFVIYAEDFEKSGTEVARTYQEYGMVLSDKRLKEVTQRLPIAFAQYVESTMLHEFGHQLGMGHNAESDCIMNQKVESPDENNGIFVGKFTQSDFCEFEKKQLLEIKQKFSN